MQQRHWLKLCIKMNHVFWTVKCISDIDKSRALMKLGQESMG